MSIFDNVAYALAEQRPRARTSPPPDAARARARRRPTRCAAPASTRRSADDLDRSALRLSGGQQQRLCIARALAAEPEVLLLDEPCSALDPISTATIEELIVGLRESVAIVIVTHNLQQAFRVADHVAFMHLGELVEYGSSEQVFDRPAPAAHARLRQRGLRVRRGEVASRAVRWRRSRWPRSCWADARRQPKRARSSNGGQARAPGRGAQPGLSITHAKHRW